jgi:hypothetical protein
MGGVEVFAVKGRVFAHQHRTRVGHGALALLHGTEPVVCVPCERDLAHRGQHALTALPAQLPRLGGQQAVAAPGGLPHHGKRGVFMGLEALKRVGNE